MRRSWILVALMGCAVVGAILIITAEDDPSGPALDAVVTDEGLETRVPQGWTAVDGVPFEFAPPGSTQPFDQWTVARGCPVDGCGERDLAEWLEVAEALPTFANVQEAGDDTIFDIEEEQLDDARVLRARTQTGGRLVFVAAFTDGASSYVACSARISVSGDEQLGDAIVDVCRETTFR